MRSAASFGVIVLASLLALIPSEVDGQRVSLAYQHQGWSSQEVLGGINSGVGRLGHEALEFTVAFGRRSADGRGVACGGFILFPSDCPEEPLEETTTVWTASMGYAFPIRSFGDGARLDVVPSIGVAWTEFTREGLETGNEVGDDARWWDLGAAIRYTSQPIGVGWARVFAEAGGSLAINGKGQCLDCFDVLGGNSNRGWVMVGIVVGDVGW